MAEIRPSYERRQRHVLAGVVGGGVLGAFTGALVAAGSVLVHAGEAVVFGMLIGAVLGGWMGGRVRRRIVDDVSPPLQSERSYVGARVPDDR